MRFLLSVMTISFLTCFNTYGQSILNSEFQWIEYQDCLPHELSSIEVFAKVEQDPILTQFDESRFEQFIQKSLSSLNLTSNQNGVLKLKLLFANNQNLCIKAIGAKNLSLSENQAVEFSKSLNSIDKFERGRQKDLPVNCQGILYLFVENGKLRKLRNVNFQFLD